MLKSFIQKYYLFALCSAGLAALIVSITAEPAKSSRGCVTCPTEMVCDSGCVINVNPLNLADANKINLVTSCYVRNCPPFPQQFSFLNGIPDNQFGAMDVYLNNQLVSPAFFGLTFLDSTTFEVSPILIQPGTYTVDVYLHTVSPAPPTRTGPGTLTTTVTVTPGNNLTVVANVGPTGTQNLAPLQVNFTSPPAGTGLVTLYNLAQVNNDPLLQLTFTLSSPTFTANLAYGQSASFIVPFGAPSQSYTLTVQKGLTVVASATQTLFNQQENGFYFVGTYDDTVSPIVNDTGIVAISLPANPPVQDASIIDVKYDGTGETVVAKMSEVGPIYGLSWRKQSDDLFASVFYKRFNDLKPGDSLGTIYLLGGVNANPSAPSVTKFIDLDFFFPGEFGFNTNRCVNNDDVALAGTTTTGIGAITLNGEGDTLFVVDLFKDFTGENNIYAVPTTIGGVVTPYSPGDPRTIIKIPVLANTQIFTNIYHNAPILAQQSPKNVRPFAIKYHNGRIYVGIVWTAQYLSTGIAPTTTDDALAMQSQMHAYVYSFPNDPLFYNDPTAWVLETHFYLNYLRNKPKTFMTPVTGYDFAHGSWFPWTDNVNVYFKNLFAFPSTNWPTPILSDIEFIIDQKTNQEVMILGFRDRTADQLLDETQTDQQYTANSAGDTLRVDRINGQWIVESDIFNGNEFFIGNTTNIHGQTTQGAVVANYSDFNEIVSTALDPLITYSSGFIMLPMNGPLAGQRRFGITIFATDPNNPASLGKANGLGSLVSLSINVPYCLSIFANPPCISLKRKSVNIDLKAVITAEDATQQPLLSQELYNVEALLLDGTSLLVASNVPFSTAVQFTLTLKQYSRLQALKIYDTKNSNCAIFFGKDQLCNL